MLIFVPFSFPSVCLKTIKQKERQEKKIITLLQRVLKFYTFFSSHFGVIRKNVTLIFVTDK